MIETDDGLERFVEAQAPVYKTVLKELRAGHKRTHWMWFIFPQIAGLGHSDMARHYALADLEEARSYFAHPVLGARLRECTEAVLLHAPSGVAPRPLSVLFGYPDDLKFHSSMTLFHRALPDEDIFTRVLHAFWNGAEDAGTISKL